MEIKRVAILGSGRLGRGIAETAASKGYDVTLIAQGDSSQDALRRIERSLDKKLAKWAITEAEKRVILSKISQSADLKEIANADLVIEATIDQLYTKQEVLRTADRLCRPEVVFMLTSATLCVSEIARILTRSDLLVGVHFIPPVTDVDVVEFSYIDETAKSAVEVAENFVIKLGKEPVHISETTGLVNPRTLCTLISEAAQMLDEGIGSAAAVEKILKGSWSMAQGPFEMADRIGLDVVLNWMEQLQAKYGDRYAPPALLRRYIRQGQLGVKTGRGFFSYTTDDRIDTTRLEQEER